jgi:hypothetical protein
MKLMWKENKRARRKKKVGTAPDTATDALVQQLAGLKAEYKRF